MAWSLARYFGQTKTVGSQAVIILSFDILRFSSILRDRKVNAGIYSTQSPVLLEPSLFLDTCDFFRPRSLIGGIRVLLPLSSRTRTE